LSKIIFTLLLLLLIININAIISSSTYHTRIMNLKHFIILTGSNNVVYVLVEAVDNYNSDPICCAVSSAEAFVQTIDNYYINNPGKYSTYFYFDQRYNDTAKPSQWWTIEFGGSNLISKYDYVLFVGHSGINGISFSTWDNDKWGDPYSTAYFDFEKEGITMTHVDGLTRWNTIAGCNVLYFPRKDNKDGMIYHLFNGGKKTYAPINTYLHGIASMASFYLFELGGHDVSTPTLKEYAQLLIKGYSIKDAWFKAVHDNQYCYNCVLGGKKKGEKVYDEWHGKPAVLYPYIVVKLRFTRNTPQDIDSSGNEWVIAEYNPGDEGMEPFGLYYIKTPKEFYNYYMYEFNPPPGTIKIVSVAWCYIVG